jgi:Pyridoxamine 5'-phosphate oxidase
MPRLTPEDLEEFLNEYSVAHIATLTETGAPYVVPMAFGYTGSTIIMSSRARSVWYENLVRDPRASLSIDEPGPPGRRVTVKAVEATMLYPPGREQEWVDVKRTIDTKAQFAMLAPEVAQGELTKEQAWELARQRGDHYIASTREVPYALWSVPFEFPSPSVSTWRPSTSEGDLSGMWPARYGKITTPGVEAEVFKGWMDQPPST